LRSGDKRTGSSVTEAVDRGFYDRQLATWEAYADAGRLLVLQYEQCVSSPEEQLVKTYRFLGLDDTFRPQNLKVRVNETSDSMLIDAEVRNRLIDLYIPDVMALAKRCPDIDLSLWPHFAGLQ
jgi:hypothetical protein